MQDYAYSQDYFVLTALLLIFTVHFAGNCHTYDAGKWNLEFRGLWTWSKWVPPSERWIPGSANCECQVWIILCLCK